MTPFRFPIPPDALRIFQHPRRHHVFAAPAMLRGDACACDGFAAIRAHRGHWLEEDWPPASAAFVERWGKIPWDGIPAPSHPHWVPLDDVRGAIAAAADTIRVGAAIFRSELVRRIARLPQAAIVPPRAWDGALYCSFNGGEVVIANLRLEHAATTIFRPRTDLDGTPLGPRGIPRQLPPCILPAKKWMPDFESL